jgi:ribose transport system substrate-binding protein
MFDHYRSKLTRSLTAGVALVTIGGALSACSSSKTSTSSATTASSSATTATGSSATTASGGGSSAAVTAAEQIVAAAEQPPTHIPQTTPLTSAPPKGKTFVFLQCEVAQCTDIASGIKAATSAVGWNLKTIPFQSANPATLVSAMQQALQYNPVAVAFSGLPEVTWQSEIPAYQKAGVIMIPAFMGQLTTPSPVVPYDIGAYNGTVTSAKQIAAWITEKSNANAKVLSVGVPSFPLLATYTTAFASALGKDCSACTISTINATIPEVDAGQIDSLIVSALQKDPSIKYVTIVDGAFVDGLPSALAAAGLTGKVQITGIGADVANETNILSGGDFKAFTALATLDSGWLMVDAALRHVEGMPVTATSDGGLPGMLLTKNSMTKGHIPAANSFNFPADYPQQFMSLWHVG